MRNIFDSHAHYDSEDYNEDREEILASLPDKGIFALINIGADIKSSYASVELSEKYDYIYSAVGVHPSEVVGLPDDWKNQLKELSKSKKCVAIGEIGLDYHYDEPVKEIQLEYFEKQLMLAKELDMPVIIHNREAHEDTLNLLKKYNPRGVVHCFSGSVEIAKEVLSLGMYIGLGGACTFKNAKKNLQVAAMVPKDRLLIETDCPWMAPVPFRGTRNCSSLIPYTAKILAETRGISAEELLETTKQNALDLFKI